MFLKKIPSIYFLIVFLPSICFADVRIFTFVPRSGAYKLFGDEITHGAEIAVDEINKHGGIRGQKIELISVDDPCKQNLAISTSQMISSNSEIKPKLVIGPYCSQGLDEISKIYEKAKIFQIAPAFLTAPQNKKNYLGLIQLFGNKEQAAKDLFDFYNKHFAGQSVALISKSENENLDINILSTFKKHGKSSLIHQYRQSDFETVDDLTDFIAQKNFDIVLSFDNPKYTGKIIRNLSQINPKTLFITSRYIATPDFFEHAENHLDNTVFMALSEFEDRPEMAQDVVLLRLKGIEFKGLNIYGYTAVKMWAELAQKSKTFDYDKLSQHIKKYGLKAPWGETFFTNGTTKNPLEYSFYKYQGGDFILK